MSATRFGKRLNRLLRAGRQSFAVRWFVLGIAAAALLTYGGWNLWCWYVATHNRVAVPSPTATVTFSTDTPDETKVSASASFAAQADQPMRISLPTVKAEGLLQKVGLDQHNAIAVPGNVTVAGWYVLGPKPGDNGVSLIDGHVQGRYTAGIFKRLAQLRAGDRFFVGYGDGSQRQFEVVHVATYDAADAAKHMLEPAAGLHVQLNLMTCGGRYDKTAGEYEGRVLVVAKRI